MNTFFFNNYEEFGLFLKINLADFLMISSTAEEQAVLNEYLKIFEHSKGGCGCNIKARKEVAKNQYLSFVPVYFAVNETRVSLAKKLLNNPDAVAFKKEQPDSSSFFLI